jgi:hypothetical protein
MCAVFFLISPASSKWLAVHADSSQVAASQHQETVAQCSDAKENTLPLRSNATRMKIQDES